MHRIIVLALVSLVILSSCTPPPKTDSGTASATPKPELSIQVATLNFSAFNKRLEKADVVQLAQILKREQIDVLSIQGLVRYPDLSTRVDLLKELPAQIDMRTAFGEMVSSSGKQTGNVVFSSFPIMSHHNQPFDGVRSASFEAVLGATIDGGVHSITVASATLPSKSTTEDLDRCEQVILEMAPRTQPLIVTGNLSSPPPGLNDVGTQLATGRAPAGTALWYADGPLKPTSVRVVPSNIAPLLVARFDVYRAPQP